MDKITSVVKEVSKKAKSWKVILDGKSYYCKENLMDLAGKTIEAEYYPKKWDDEDGNEHTSKWLVKESIKVVSGGSPSQSSQAKPEGKVDWDSKDRRMVRMSAWKDVAESGGIIITDFEKAKELAHKIEEDIYR